LLTRMVQAYQKRLGQLSTALGAAGVPGTLLAASDTAAAMGALQAPTTVPPDSPPRITPTASATSLTGGPAAPAVAAPMAASAPVTDVVELLDAVQRERGQFHAQAQVGTAWVCTVGRGMRPTRREHSRGTALDGPQSHVDVLAQLAQLSPAALAERVEGRQDLPCTRVPWGATRMEMLTDANALGAGLVLVHTVVASLPAHRASLDEVRSAVLGRVGVGGKCAGYSRAWACTGRVTVRVGTRWRCCIAA
jgi:hypothetical protein